MRAKWRLDRENAAVEYARVADLTRRGALAPANRVFPAEVAGRANTLDTVADVSTADWCRPLDVIVAVAALFAVVRWAGGEVMPQTMAEFLAMRITVKNALVAALFVTMWPMALTFAGVYDRVRGQSLFATLRPIVLGCALGTVGAIVVPLTSNSGFIGLEVLPWLWLATTVGTLGVRGVVRIAAYVRRSRSTPRRVLIAGSGKRAAMLWRELSANPLQRYELVAISDVPESEVDRDFADRAFVPAASLEDFFMRTVVDEVYVAMPVRSRYREIENILAVCQRGGVHSHYMTDTFTPTIARPKVNRSSGPSMVAMHVVHNDWRLALKRGLDVVLASCGLIVLAPLLLLVAVAIKLSAPGPVFFSQERFGLNKRRFRMFKFRTMVVDAERLMADLEKHNEATGAAFKMRNDPRITRIGRILRRTSLDELPQLWNVVIGDMALVGPRPMAVRDVSLFDEAWLMRRFSVRPGLTCLWQISGRSNLTFTEWMHLDLKYIDNWSLRMDVAILARTLPAVVSGNGAT